MEDDLDLAGGLYQPHEMSEIERLADGFRTGQTDGTAISLSQTSETWGLPSPRAQGGAAALSQGGAVRPEPLLRINAPRPRLSSLEDEDGSHEGEDLDLLRGREFFYSDQLSQLVRRLYETAGIHIADSGRNTISTNGGVIL